MTRPPLFACALAGFAVLAPLRSQEGKASVSDTKAAQEALSYSDAVSFRTWTTGSDLHFEVEMKRPHKEGMYTCLHVYLDADSKPKTGIQGAEIWMRAALGSRYHPNSYAPKQRTAGVPAMELTKASFSHAIQGRGGKGKTWLHTTVLDKPEIEPTKIRFKVPTSLIRQHGDRYGSVTGVRAEVETSCTDQPLMMRHICDDDGVSIRVDGDARDWSHPQIVRDPPGELHKVGQILDLVRLQVEHDKSKLYALVELAQPGLRRDDLSREDVERYDGVSIYVEPMYPRYQDPVKLFMRFGRGGHPVAGRDRLGFRFQGLRSSSLNWSGQVNDKYAEVAVPRRPGQNEFRVWAWSDLRRLDRLPNDGWLRVDWGKK